MSTGIWVQAEGVKGGAIRRWKQKQTQACGVERRDEQPMMASGGCGKQPGIHSYAQVKEMGSRRDREVLKQRTATGLGEGRMEEVIKIDPETVETGTAGGDKLKLLSINDEA